MKFAHGLILLFCVSGVFAGFETHNIELRDFPVSIDGDVSEWASSTWIDMNLVYDKRGSVTEATLLERVEAAYSVRFDLSSQSLVVAARAKDDTDLRTNSFSNWNNQDHFQFFVAHPAANDINIFYGDWYPEYQQQNAQQYCIGVDAGGTGGWATMENQVVQDALLPAGFSYAASYDGTWQYVEAIIPIFQEYGAYTGTATIQGASLGAGDIVKFDALYISANPDFNDPAKGKYEGTLANNTQKEKFSTPETIAEHLILLPEPIAACLLAGGFLFIRKRM